MTEDVGRVIGTKERPAARVLGRRRRQRLRPARRGRRRHHAAAAAPRRRPQTRSTTTASSTRSSPPTRAPASTPTSSATPTARCPSASRPSPTSPSPASPCAQRTPDTTRGPRPAAARPAPCAAPRGNDRELALYFDQMKRSRFAAGLSRDGLPVYGNLEFLDGTPRRPRQHLRHLRRRHQDDLRPLPALRPLPLPRRSRNPHSTHAIVFNVKGEDLLWLDKPNAQLPPRRAPQVRGPRPARRAPSPTSASGRRPRRGDIVLPDTGCAHRGCRRLLLDPARVLPRPHAALPLRRRRRRDQPAQLRRHPGRALPRSQMASTSPPTAATSRLTSRASTPASTSTPSMSWSTSSATSSTASRRAPRGGTRQAFARRFEAAAVAVAPLIRAVRDSEAAAPPLRLGAAPGQRHRHQPPQRPRQALRRRRRRAAPHGGEGASRRPRSPRLPRPGRAQQVRAARGPQPDQGRPARHRRARPQPRRRADRRRSRPPARSSAASPPTPPSASSAASTPPRAQRDEYGFLTASARVRSSILKPGSMFLQQPDVPVPLLVQFPFPAWATRADEVAASARENGNDVFARIRAQQRLDEVPPHLRLARRPHDPRPEPRSASTKTPCSSCSRYAQEHDGRLPARRRRRLRHLGAAAGGRAHRLRLLPRALRRRHPRRRHRRQPRPPPPPRRRGAAARLAAHPHASASPAVPPTAP